MFYAAALVGHIPLVVAFAVALALTWLLVPIAIRIAVRTDFYDIPIWGSIPLWVCLLLIGREQLELGHAGGELDHIAHRDAGPVLDLSGLNPPQREAVLTTEGPVLVLGTIWPEYWAIVTTPGDRAAAC